MMISPFRRVVLIFFIAILCLASILGSDKYLTNNLSELAGGNRSHGGGAQLQLLSSKRSPQNNKTSSNNNDQEHQPIILSSHTISITRKKPRFIIHVGPPKTATTTIQWALVDASWESQLRQDNIVVLHPNKNRRERFGKEFFGRTCHDQMSQARRRAAQEEQEKEEKAATTNSTTKKSIFEIVYSIPCAQKLRHSFQQLLAEYNYSHDNNNIIHDEQRVPTVVISAEPLSYSKFYIHGLAQRTCADWISLRALLYEWDISTIIVYRRFFEWLPSAKQQIERWTTAKPRMNKWASQGGKAIQSLVPNFRHFRIDYRNAEQVVESIKGAISFNLLNMHEPGQSILTTFFCDGLQASTSCKHSRKLDESETTEPRKNPSQTLFYDSIVVKAEPLFHGTAKQYRRHDIAVAAEKYWESNLNKTVRDLPLTCPTPHQYDDFLNVSLAMEERLLPQFHESPHGRAEHVRLFQATVKSQKLCHIDTESALKDPLWIQFFEQYTSASL